MPVLNEAAHLPATIDALADGARRQRLRRRARRSSTTARPTAAPTSRELRADGRLPLRVVRAARTAAASRRAGRASRRRAASYVLLPRRARAARPGRAALRARAPADGEPVWNGHVHVDADNAVRRLLAPARRARVARLLRRPADDELRRRGLRPLPEGDDVLPRAAERCSSRRSPRFRTRYARRAARERRHADPARSRRAASASTSRRSSRAATRRARRSARFFGTRSTAGRSSSTATARPSRASSRPSSRSSRSAPRWRSRRYAARRSLPAALAGLRLRRPRPTALRAGRSRREVAVARDRDAALRRSATALGMWRGARSSCCAVILVVFGTTGELIKLAPVLLRLDERGHRYLLATTGQQVQQIPAFLEQFGLRQPDLWLARGRKRPRPARELRHPRLARDGHALVAARTRQCGARCATARAPARARPRRHDDDGARAA